MTPLTETIGVWAGIAQAIFTIIAIFLGGIFAWRRGYFFRHGQPHVTIAHKITHRQISDSYVHIEVTAILRNTSLVKVEIRDGLFTIQQLAPFADAFAEELYAQTFIDQQHNGTLQWLNLNETRLSWNRDDLIAEPGESVAVTFEYIIPNFVASILITTYFYNLQVMGKIDINVDPRQAEPRKRFWPWQHSGAKGWIRTTAHDIILNGGRANTEMV